MPSAHSLQAFPSLMQVRSGLLLDPLPHQRLQGCDAHVPQLQSLHLHVQAPVLTGSGLDSLLSVWTPVLCSLHSVARVPTPAWGWKVFHQSPGTLVVFALPFPEHLTSGKNCWIKGQGSASGRELALSMYVAGLLGV